MNLLSHIITCSPQSMNLPAHGTTSPNPSIMSLRKSNTHKPLSIALSPDAAPSAARQNQCRPPSGTSPPLGAGPSPNPLFYRYCLAEHTLPPGATQCKDLSRWSYRLAHTLVPSSATPITYQLFGFLALSRAY